MHRVTSLRGGGIIGTNGNLDSADGGRLSENLGLSGGECDLERASPRLRGNHSSRCPPPRRLFTEKPGRPLAKSAMRPAGANASD